MKQGQYSPYLEWVKANEKVKYNLATSGVVPIRLTNLPFKQAKFEVNSVGSNGYQPLLRMIAERYRVDVANIVTTIGASMAHFLIMSALLERGDEVIIEHPTYEPFVSMAQYLGAKIKRFDRNFESKFTIEVKSLQKKVTRKTKLIILTNLHNPSSAYTDEQTLKVIGEIAREVKARVLVNEVYLASMFGDTPATSFLLGNEFIVTNSLTKVYGLPGTRCGWIFADPDIIKTLQQMSNLIYGTHAHPAEQLSYLAFAVLEQLSQRSESILALNRKILYAFFDKHPQLEVFKPQAGTVVFPRLLKGNSEKFTTMLSEKYETLVVPGSFFEMPEHFRISIGCTTNTLKRGLKRIHAALEEFFA